jgi:hypothetical protein
MSLKQEMRERLDKKVKLRAVGNTHRKLRDVAVDLINAADLPYAEIAAGTYLCKSTIKNLGNDHTRNPQSETLERIFRFFEYNVALDRVAIKAQYRNQPKGKRRKKK